MSVKYGVANEYALDKNIKWDIFMVEYRLYWQNSLIEVVIERDLRWYEFSLFNTDYNRRGVDNGTFSLHERCLTLFEF